MGEGGRAGGGRVGIRKIIMAGRGRYSYMDIRLIFALVLGACDTVASLFGANRHMFTT